MVNETVALLSDTNRTAYVLGRFRQYLNESFDDAEDFVNYMALKVNIAAENDPDFALWTSSNEFENHFTSVYDTFTPPSFYNTISQLSSPTMLSTASSTPCSNVPDLGIGIDWVTESIIGAAAGWTTDIAGKAPYLKSEPLYYDVGKQRFVAEMTSSQAHYHTWGKLANILGKATHAAAGGFAAWEIGQDIGSEDWAEVAKDSSIVAGSFLAGVMAAGFVGPGLLAASIGAAAAYGIKYAADTYADDWFDSVLPRGDIPKPTPCETPKTSDASELQEIIALATKLASPLILDLNGDGINTASVTSSDAVYFDHGEDSFAEASGWTAGGDGLLAIDLNNDSVINDGGELFGDQTGERNGFEVLFDYDSNGDGEITSEDAKWAELRVWIDSNQDGYSQEDELKTLDELNITQINLSYTEVNQTNNGNSINETGTFVMNDQTRIISDVYFSVDRMNSVYNEDYELELRALFLPALRGYGELPSLHIAMSLDNDGTGNLLGLVQDFANLEFAEIFSANDDALADVKAILFRWAGAENIADNSRGPSVNAKELTFLEKLTGEPFLQRGYSTNPMTVAGEDLTQAFQMALNGFYGRLVAQGAGKELFTGNVQYNLATDEIEGITGINTVKLDELETTAALLGNTTAKEIFWSNVVRFVESAAGIDTLSISDRIALEDAITTTDSSLDLQDLIDDLVIEQSRSSTYGDSGDNSMVGTVSADSIWGYGGNDTINAGSGDDLVYGGNDNDTLQGHTGSDYIEGGYGNDIYVYNVGDGDDVYDDLSGNDKIVFGPGIAASDLTFTRVSNGDLLINIDNGSSTGSILVQDQFNYTSTGGIETIEFADNSTLALNSITYLINGTAGNDVLDGISSGGSINDTIDAGAGHDIVHAGAGDDIVYGGTGNDKIYGSNGNDTLYGEDGDDLLQGFNDNDHMHGGAGNDILEGYAGDDSYYFTSGHDIYRDGILIGGASNPGTDVIYAASGFTSANTVYYKIGSDLKVVFDQNNSITVNGHFTNNNYVIETLNFDNGPVINLATVSYTLQGDENNNTLNGTANIDVLYGMGGNDTLYGKAANDSLYGGLGNDTLNGEDGDDFLDGGAGNDMLNGGAGNDVYYYVSGLDVINETSGNADTLKLMAGFDPSSVTFKRYAASGNDLVIEISSANKITVQQHFNSTYGTNAKTVEFIEYGNNVIESLMGRQYETYGSENGDTIYGVAANGSINDIIHALAGNDTVYGRYGDDIIYGGDGNDILHGDQGNDVLEGGAGDDTINGGADSDTYVYTSGHDIYSDSSGTDEIQLYEGLDLSNVTFRRYSSSANDLKIEIDANNSITIKNQFYAAYSAMEGLRFADNTTIDLTTRQYETYGTGAGDTIHGITINGSIDDIITSFESNDIIHAGYGNDYVDGGGGNDTLNGGAGNDTLRGGDGDDILNGDIGNDYMDGDAGNDTLRGGTGNDTYVYSGGMDKTIETGSSSDVDVLKFTGTTTINDLLLSSSGYNLNIILEAGVSEILLQDHNRSTLNYHIEKIVFDDGFFTTLTDHASWMWGTSSNDTLTGTSAHDTLIGKDGDDVIDGLGADDNIHGGNGNDTLIGGTGNDLLHGGAGNDIINGGEGLDELFGGAGNDIFVFETASAFTVTDTIRDFSATDDSIDLSDLLTGFDPLNNLISDYVSFTDSGTNSIISVDRDGTGTTYEFDQIALANNVTGLNADDLFNTGQIIV